MSLCHLCHKWYTFDNEKEYGVIHVPRFQICNSVVSGIQIKLAH